MVETIGEISGLVWIRKHTSFAHWVFQDLRSGGSFRRG